MESVLLGVGRLAGMLGILVAAAAVVLRLGGIYIVAGLGTNSVLFGGMAALLAGCFCLLLVLVQRAPR
jgi:hypothetical protein